MTVYFVIFGNIIGYFSFIFYTIISSNNSINFSTSMVKNRYAAVSNVKEGDFLLDVINNTKDDVTDTASFFKNIKTDLKDVSSIHWYYHDKASIQWKEIYIDDGNMFSAKSVNPLEKERLDEAAEADTITSSGIFFGKSDMVTVMINLTRHIDKNKYVLSFVARRMGILSILEDNMLKFTFFGLVLFVFSIILGNVFAATLTRQINWMSMSASEIASGKFNKRFTVNSSDEIGVLAESLNVMTEKIESHVNEIKQRMQAMETMNTIDKMVLSSISRSDLLEKVIGIVSSLFDSNHIAIALHNDQSGGFDIMSYDKSSLKAILKEKPFVKDSELASSLLKQIKKLFQINKQGEIIDNKGKIKKGKSAALSRIQGFFKRLVSAEAGSVINVPLYISENYLGSLVMAMEDEKGFSSDKVETIRMLADQVAVALQSVRVFEEKEDLFVGILIALTNSIDAKSRWTAGHSERVARLAESVAVRMNFTEEQIRNITISSILHDIGKIAIPERILDKNGDLTDEEYSIIKEHSSRGAEIISHIPSYENILPGIVSHHEYWDGSGYPMGLKGEDIPLESRIITVVDVYDSITVDRPYRKASSKDEAIKYIIDNKGKIFDPVVVDHFLEVLDDEPEDNKS